MTGSQQYPDGRSDWHSLPSSGDPGLSGPARTVVGVPPLPRADGLTDADHRMGLTRDTPEGAGIDFVGRLDGGNPRHRRIAMVLLLLWALPMVLTLVAGMTGRL